MRTQKMVTRTITTKTIQFMGVYVSKGEVANYTEENVAVKDGKELDYIKSHYETDDFKVVAITNIVMNELLYGMTEQEFLAHARVLPPRTKADDEE